MDILACGVFLRTLSRLRIGFLQISGSFSFFVRDLTSNSCYITCNCTIPSPENVFSRRGGSEDKGNFLERKTLDWPLPVQIMSGKTIGVVLRWEEKSRAIGTCIHNGENLLESLHCGFSCGTRCRRSQSYIMDMIFGMTTASAHYPLNLGIRATWRAFRFGLFIIPEILCGWMSHILRVKKYLQRSGRVTLRTPVYWALYVCKNLNPCSVIPVIALVRCSPSLKPWFWVHRRRHRSEKPVRWKSGQEGNFWTSRHPRRGTCLRYWRYGGSLGRIGHIELASACLRSRFFDTSRYRKENWRN